jgi:hypothetical protein
MAAEVEVVAGEIVDPLTPAEQAQLDQDEATIESGLASFVEVGRSLADIRDKRLYRAKHGTFEKYVDVRWGIARRTYQQMIAASRTVASIEAETVRANRAPDHLPKSEWVARPLVEYRAHMRKLEKLNEARNEEVPEDPDTEVIRENLADAWGAVVDEAAARGSRITRALVEQVLVEEKLLPPKLKPGQSRIRNLNEQIGEVADRLIAADKFLKKIRLTAETQRDKDKALKFAEVADSIAARLREVAGDE